MASNVCPALRNAPKKDEKKYAENHLAACVERGIRPLQ
jgi:hypothetical protein